MSDTPPTLESPAIQPAPKKKTGKNIGLLLVLLACGVAVAYFLLCPKAAPPHATNVEVGGQNAVLQAEIDSLTLRVKNLEGRTDANAPPAVAAPAAAPPEEPHTDATTTAALSHVQNDMVSLSAAVAGLQSEIKAEGSASAETREATVAMISTVVAYIQLHEAEVAGRKFAAELDTLRDTAKNDAALQASVARLQPYAAAGVPTLEALRQELLVREPSVAVAIAKGNAQNWWQRLMAGLQGLITVRPIHGGEGDVLAQLEQSLTGEGAAAALDVFKTLPADAQRDLADWKSHLEARQYVDEELATIASHFTAPPQAKTP